jgi:manganese transport protein
MVARQIEKQQSAWRCPKLIPLVLFTRRQDLMGELVNHRLTTLVASLVAAIIVGLNLYLLWQTFFGSHL